jgi:hypothetical protein
VAQLRPRAPGAARAPFLHAVPAPDRAPGRTQALSTRAYALLAGLAVFAAFMVRAGFVFDSSFPLNDGGLFYVMAQEIEDAHFALPHVTAYNHAGIPFVYPPLAMYIAATLDRATPLSLIDVFRLMPLAVSTASVGAFLLLARRFFARREAVVVAAFLFGMIPPTFDWMIMGGGLTRSLGFAFALLALHEAHAAYTERAWRRGVTFGVLAGLTVLSHLEMATFTAFTTGLFFLFHGRHRAGVIASGVGGVIAAAVSAPWWATIIARHGLAPLLAARASGGESPGTPAYALLNFNATGETLFPAVAVLALLGIVACLLRREYLLPAWFLAAIFLDPRAARPSSAAALALLATVGIFAIVVPLLNSPAAVQLEDAGYAVTARGLRPSPRWLAAAAVIGIVGYTTISAMVSQGRLLSGMTPDERAAMAWVAQHTPADARFAVVTDDGWARDRTSEWFPALTGRQSVATVQGLEWMPGAYRTARTRYLALQKCSRAAASCLGEWSATNGVPFDYVYIPAIPPRIKQTEDDPCCAALRIALASDGGYERVYDGPGAVVYHRKGAP